MRAPFLYLLTLPFSAGATTAEQLVSLAPQLRHEVAEEALQAIGCAAGQGLAASAQHLAIIDYTLPSRVPRLWVFDLASLTLSFHEHVAHGQGSGHDIPTEFSNEAGSHQSSLGLFATADTYMGGNGYSLRMDGLSGALNSAARERLIVMHGAPYVNPEAAQSMGRLGRSWGCPAVRPAVARQVIDQLKGGQLIYAFGPGSAAAADCARDQQARLTSPSPVREH